MPDAIANAPDLREDLRPYYLAFVELSTCRDHGMGIGPIPWSAIDRYADRHEFVDEEFDRLLVLVRKLDDHFLEHQRAKKDAGSGS